MKRQRGGRVLGAQNFNLEDRTALLNIVEAEHPLKPERWNAVVDRYNNTYAKVNGRRERDMASLKRQWFNMIGHPKPAADPACPEHIRRAKRIHLDISNRVDLHLIGGRKKQQSVGNDVAIKDKSIEEPELELEPEPEPELELELELESDSRPFGDDSWPQTPIPIRPNPAPSALAVATSVAGAPADRSITRSGSSGKRRSQSHTAFGSKRSTTIPEAEDLRAIFLNSLDSKIIQNQKEETRGIQTLLQLQIMNLQQELARKDDKVEKLQEKVGIPKFTNLFFFYLSFFLSFFLSCFSSISSLSSYLSFFCTDYYYFFFLPEKKEKQKRKRKRKKKKEKRKKFN